MLQIHRVILIDPDTYESSNLLGQDISALDVGKKKVRVQAKRLKSINSDVEIIPLAEPVENVPLGRLRGKLLLACLDSLPARQVVNRAALRLGIPWIDAGVRSEGLLARVDVYLPGAKRPCMECGWDDKNYSSLDQVLPCSKETAAPPTNAPSSLGALAASLQAIECSKLLADSPYRAEPGSQILVDAAHHNYYFTRFQWNPNCRLANHRPLAIEMLTKRPSEMVLGEAIGLGGLRYEQARLKVEGKIFLLGLTCQGCGRRRSFVRLAAGQRPNYVKCRRCKGSMLAGGFDTTERLELASLSSALLDRSLASLGFRAGEVFSVSDGRREKHFELAGM
jgi:molybdopterin/thiamine biosynthesis adenylyltransferase